MILDQKNDPDAPPFPLKYLLTLQHCECRISDTRNVRRKRQRHSSKPLQHAFTTEQRAALLELGKFIAYVQEQAQ